MPPHQRMFNGKKYLLAGEFCSKSKKDADWGASYIRKQGMLAKVVKDSASKQWLVYTKPKGI